MKKIIRNFILIVAVITPLTSIAGEDIFHNYATKPTEDNYIKLYKYLENVKTGIAKPPDFSKAKEYDDFYNIMQLAAKKKDGRAADITFMVGPYTDGGNLEDVFETLSAYCDTQPKEFLEKALKFKVQYTTLGFIVQWGGPKVVDKIDARVTLYENRIKSLNSVKDNRLQNIKNDAIGLAQVTLDQAIKAQQMYKKK